MAESNNRKRKLSKDEDNTDITEVAPKKQNLTQNDAEQEDSSLSKENIKTSESKSLSKQITCNIVGTIRKKTSLFTRRTLRPRRRSLQNLNYTKNCDDFNVNNTNSDGEQAIATRKQTLQKYYTLKLGKLKDKFKTRRQVRKDRFRSLPMTTLERPGKHLNQSKVEGNRQEKLLDKLLEKHNKYLDNI